jgi:predicted glycoside hydrolase/deacetylase ChbG (UPF0249 family)
MDDFGRSPNISKKILECVKFGYINSVSVMMGFSNKSYHKKLLKTNVKTKLHINLTENSQIFLKTKIKLKNLNFFSLLFASTSMKKILKERINIQVKNYIKIYGKKNLRIDGHQHIHIIPWIHNYITGKKSISIKEIRYPNEQVNIYGYNNLFKFQFYRNLAALCLVKILILFLKRKKNSPIFFGLLYSGLYNEKILKMNISHIDMKKETEILIHGGYTNNSERRLFQKEFFDYYTSKSNKAQYRLAFKKINKKL